MSVFDHIRFAVKSDIGKKRKNNEDAYGTFPESGIFCVADGMGGGDDGEVASAATVREVQCFCESHKFPPQLTYTRDDILAGIRASINTASAWIFRRAKERGLKGCGSTFVGVVFDAARPDQAVALHAGDSRLYRIRGRTIQQITTDHSAAELIGAKDEKDINPMFRGMILRAVGIQSSVELQATEFPVREGDRVLICSDGLSRMVPDKQLLSIIRANGSPQTAVDALVAAANAAGGVDNITVELIEIGPLPLPVPAIPMQVSATSDAPSADPSTSATWTGIDGSETFESNSGSGGGGEPFESDSEDLFSAAPTLGLSDDEDAQTCSTVTIPEASDEAKDDDEPSTPKMSASGGGRRSRRWVWYVGVLLLLGVITGVDYLILRTKSRPPVKPPETGVTLPVSGEIVQAAVQDAKALVPQFEAAVDREAWDKAEEDRLRRMGKWDKGLLGDKYKELQETVLAARNKAKMRIDLLKACGDAANAVESAFVDAKDKAALNTASESWKGWQEKWSREADLDKATYAGLDGQIRAASESAGQRIEDAVRASLLTECRTGADKVKNTFGRVEARASLEAAEDEWKVWRDRWTQEQKLDKATYAGLDGQIQSAREAAEKRVKNVEQEQVSLACRKTVTNLTTHFGSVNTRDALTKADGTWMAWRNEWKRKVDTKLFAELDGQIQTVRDAAEKRVKKAESDRKKEIERKRQNILKVYEESVKDEPVASRRKRLDDAKGMLEASRKENLFAEEEIKRRLAEIETRRAWTVGKIANRADGEIVVGEGKKPVRPGETATVVFKDGTSWMAARSGYVPVTLTREELDGKTVTLGADRWKALPVKKPAEAKKEPTQKPVESKKEPIQKPAEPRKDTAQKPVEAKKMSISKKPEEMPKQEAVQKPAKKQNPADTAKKPAPTFTKVQAEQFVDVLRQVAGDSELLERFETEVKKLGETGALDEGQCGEIISLLDQIAENISEVAEQELQVVGVDENEQDQVNSRKEKYTALQAACKAFFATKGNDKLPRISRIKNFFDAVGKASAQK